MRVRSASLLVSLMVLAACGGGGGGPVTANPPSPAPSPSPTPSPVTGVTVTDGALRSANTASRNGEVVPLNINGGRVQRAFSSAAIFSDGLSFYRVATAPDEESYAIVGFRGTDRYIGAIASADTPAPTSGSATYTGSYVGEILGAFSSTGDSVRGTASVTADFDSNSIETVISNRVLPAPSSGYNVAQVQADLVFDGTINSDGSFDGDHAGGGTTGSLIGALYEDGAVGATEVIHSNGSQFTNSDLLETGVFGIV